MSTKEDLLKVTKKISVLYAEDEQMIREQYASIFNLLFQEVVTAEDGLDALEKYKKKQYDLIITDLTMPKMDGVRLIEKVLEINPAQHIIIMTAHNSNENLRASIDFQVDGILLKPVKKEKLFSLLEKVGQHLKPLKKEPTLVELEERFEKSLLTKDLNLFIVVVDRLDKLIKEFGMEVKEFILDAVKEHLFNFGIEKEDVFKIYNDVILFTAEQKYLDGVLQTLQDFSQQHRNIEVLIHDLKFYITLSYGFIMYRKTTQNNQKSHDYMHQIDNLVEEIKQNKYSTDIVTMDADIEETKKSNAFKWLSLTLSALEQKEIVPFFQPTVDIETLQIASYDIYARLRQDEKFIVPSFFLDLSEKAGIVEDITRSIFEQGFEKLSTTDYPFHINVGNYELREHAFLEYLLYLCSRFEIEHKRVILDILYYEDITPKGKRVQTLLKLKDLGFQIAIKVSINTNINIELLSLLQPDYIKINQEVVQKALIDRHTKLLLHSFLKYTTKADIKTILFYVEDKNILEQGRALGFDYVQGYLIAKPSERLETTQYKEL